MRPQNEPGSTILHRCNGGECFCMYDPECTGVLGHMTVVLPLWLGALLRPLHTVRVLDARRRLRRELVAECERDRYRDALWEIAQGCTPHGYVDEATVLFAESVLHPPVQDDGMLHGGRR